jgi:hypothetical protein
MLISAVAFSFAAAAAAMFIEWFLTAVCPLRCFLGFASFLCWEWLTIEDMSAIMKKKSKSWTPSLDISAATYQLHR